MQLSVVIVNYNVRYFLRLCLQSVKAAIDGVEAEVYVVDNNSSDDSVEMVKELFPWVKLIANKHNAGFGVANNQAITIAQGKYILLQNPDTIVAEDTYKRIIEFMELSPEAGGLGVKMIDGSGKFLPESKRGLPTPEVAFYKIFGLSLLFPRSKLFGKYHLGYLDNNEVQKVDVLSGAFMLIRKEVIDRIGAFDERFFMYGEDIDLSFRITEAGYKNFYYPGTSIIHYKGESTKKGSLNYVFVFYKAMIIFARKHFASQKAALFSLLINMAVYLRAFLALFFRFISLFVKPALDAVVMLLTMLVIIPGYESYKFEGAGQFPGGLYSINLPMYIGLWIAGLYFTNNYSKPFPRFISLLYGMILGAVFISVVYAFLEESLRSSRALIIIGTAANCLMLFLYRWIWQIFSSRSFSFYNKASNRVLFIGDADGKDEFEKLLKKSNGRYELLGFAGTRQEEELQNGFLGHYTKLGKMLRLYKVNELVFTSTGIFTKEIIHFMEEHGKRFTYKIFDLNGQYALGSNSKNAAGELFTETPDFSLSTSEARYNKRFTDIILTIFLVPLSPLVFWWLKRKKGLLVNIFDVMRSRKTWVGYARADKNLPQVKPHIIKTTYESDPEMVRNTDLQYARNYSSVRDVILILRNLAHLGD
jgi:GT2 family glycosyltransferase